MHEEVQKAKNGNNVSAFYYEYFEIISIFFFLQYKTRAVHNFIYSGQYSVEEEFCVLSQNTHKRSKHIFVSYHHHRTKSVDGWKGG